MAGPKKQTPPPIDRPLSRAYLRNFTGWSTAFPPGLSDPTSCRQMENMMVTRDKGLRVRPGLRYASYLQTPDMDAVENKVPGIAFDMPLVGSLEPFYLDKGKFQGSKAWLFAVREKNDTVGFRVLLLSNSYQTVFDLTHKEIGFYIPQGVDTLHFSSATKHVTYLQIDNKILALSDAGEPVRLFNVGVEKVAKTLNPITKPEWEDEDKLKVIHPEWEWINKLAYTVRRNELLNPSFEGGTVYWNKGSMTEWAAVRAGGMASEQVGLQVWTAPQRSNLATSPLHDVAGLGTAGWHPGKDDPDISKSGDWMKVTDARGTRVFLAYSAKLPGIDEGKRYKLAFDFDLSSDAVLRARVQFYRNNGTEIGGPVKFFPSQKNGRWESPGIEAPNNAVTARIYLGADSTEKKTSWAKFKNVVLCRANEPTSMFHGSSGAGYYWTGAVNASSSWYWPNQDITITANRVNVIPGSPVTNSIHVSGMSGHNKNVDLDTFVYNRDGAQVGHTRHTAQSGAGPWTRISSTVAANAATVAAGLQVTIRDVGPFQRFTLDAGMIEATLILNPYFDGSTPSDTRYVRSWENPGAPHLCASIEVKTIDLTAIPEKQVPMDNTLIATGGSEVNKYKMGFFYTFENEIGESAPSKIMEVRTKRPQSNWLWAKPDQALGGQPNENLPTDVADLCADQLVLVVPPAVYTSALESGALKWNLYTFSWSDQDPVPVEAVLTGSRELYPDEVARLNNQALPYEKGGWINITPSRKVSIDLAPLPTLSNRVNYSKPPRSRNGIVAGDRLVLVGDADEPGAIRWTSNRPGEYLKLTAIKGGGKKTLSSGNLNLPSSVVLWQNPQSVDTLTILCLGSDGTSTCYYMTPAEVTQQTSSTQVMGFEETTNTPGTMAPYGAFVHNNALFRPIDRALLKSTAQNYNINHKSMSSDISNMWEDLQNKRWIMSEVHDNRLYFLVNNPRGEPVEEDCHGNEIWVYDMESGESGAWSRFLVHAAALQVLDYGSRIYLGVIRPDGLYYLDPEAGEDDYVLDDGTVGQRPIPWFFEMNTQGANRAHDAWAHLQQMVVTMGGFTGTLEYGIRGRTINGTVINMSKRFADLDGPEIEGLSWESQDSLLVRRDLMQWYFYARSVEGLPSSGQFNTVQYRYTPVTVNVGYEFGSVETFEYGRNVERGNDDYYANGIPEPIRDFGKM